jgi:hypothetical protein
VGGKQVFAGEGLYASQVNGIIAFHKSPHIAPVEPVAPQNAVFKKMFGDDTDDQDDDFGMSSQSDWLDEPLN